MNPLDPEGYREDKEEEKDEDAKEILKVCTFIPQLLLTVGSFIWNTSWTVAVLLANRGHVLGDEYIFTFGQVGALVAVVASLYGIVSSYLGKPMNCFMMGSFED